MRPASSLRTIACGAVAAWLSACEGSAVRSDASVTPADGSPEIDASRLDGPTVDRQPVPPDMSRLDADDAQPVDGGIDARSAEVPADVDRPDDVTTDDASLADAARVDAPFADVAGDTEPTDAGPAARPIAPHPSTRSHAGRPMFEWALPSGVREAHVQVCRDRACRSIAAEGTVSATTWQPATPLPDGLYFWRVAAVRGAPTAEAFCEVRPLRIGGTSSDDPSGLGISRDINGDGFADVVVGWRSGGYFVLLGNGAGHPTMQRTLPGGPGGVDIVGDVNGDGFADVVVGTPWTGSGETFSDVGRAALYLGGPGGVAATPARVLMGGATHDRFGESVRGAGDFNDDGFADVIVATEHVGPRIRPTPVIAYIFLGGLDAMSATPYRVLTVPDSLGASVRTIGDVDRDGYADVALTSVFFYCETRGCRGRATVLFGGGDGDAARSMIAYESPDAGGIVHSFAAAGDVDGDGFADLIMGLESIRRLSDPRPGVARLFLGRAASRFTEGAPWEGIATGFGDDPQVASRSRSLRERRARSTHARARVL